MSWSFIPSDVAVARAAVDPAALPFVARVEVGGAGDVPRGCSGVLVDPQWVLTAKTCFAADGIVAAGPPPKPTRVVVGRADLKTAAGLDTTAAELRPHAHRSVVLVRLAAPATDIAVPTFAATPPQIDQDVVAAGFGRTDTSGFAGDQLTSGAFRISQVDAESLTVVRAAGNPVGICKGEVGGPLLRASGSRYELVAIHQASWQAGCPGVAAATDAAAETVVYDLADWISEPVSPVGSWPMSESGGALLADANGIGPRRPATVTGAVLGQPGRTIGGKAAQFDGVDDHAVSSEAVLNPALGFTVSAWARPDSTGQARPVVAATGAQGNAFVLGRDATGKWSLTVAAGDSATPTLQTISGNAVSRPGVWTQVAGTYDATAKEIRLYVNGALENTVAVTGVFAAGGRLMIGGERKAGVLTTTPWHGAISEVKVWDRVIPTAQIAQGAVTTVGIWPMNGNGDDVSGRGNHVTTTQPGPATPGIVGNAVGVTTNANAYSRPGPVLRTDQSYTVAAWVRLDAKAGGFKTIIAQTGTRRSAFSLQYEDILDRYRLLVHGNDSDASAWAWAIHSVPPPVGSWQHVAGVYDATRQQIRVYVGGLLAGTATYASVWQANGELVIGRDLAAGVATRAFNGGIDDVRAYQGVLPDSEISKLATYPAQKYLSEPATPATLVTAGANVRAWKLPAATRLNPGMYAQIGRARLVMQNDGNLVLYDETGRARWAAGKFGVGNYAIMQPDGNFVLYRSDAVALWATNTSVSPAGSSWLAVQEDGNLVIYNSALATVWSTATHHPASGTGGSFVLRGVGSGLCLDAVSLTNGTQAALGVCSTNRYATQLWTWTPIDRQLRLASGKCLEAQGAGTASGTKAVINPCSTAAHQKWRLDGGEGRVINVANGLSVDVRNYGTTSGSLIHLFRALGPTNQKWNLHW